MSTVAYVCRKSSKGPPISHPVVLIECGGAGARAAWVRAQGPGQCLLRAFWASDARSIEGEGRQEEAYINPLPQAVITIETPIMRTPA